MKPVVVVLTPSMDLERYDTSSTKTPGARYSGIAISFSRSKRRKPQFRTVGGQTLGARHGGPARFETHRTEDIGCIDARERANFGLGEPG
jgi:hypothetical protein